MKGLNFINVAPLVLLLAVSLVSEVESIGCYSCWSNETAECATGPIIRVGLTDCADSDTCLTAIVGDLTFRGCSSSVTLAPDYPLKESCSVEYCNGRIYPSDRLVCYKCQGPQCIQPAGNSRPCVNYSKVDQCFTDVISDTNTIRGCVSDGNNTATEYTQTCSSNLCNNIRSYDNLECLSCASNETLDCVRPVDAGETCQISIQTTCTMNVLLGRQEFCYTYQSGDYIERGCSADSIFKSNEPMNSVEYETKCYEGNCNNECIPQSVCYVCDSVTDPNCGTNLTELTPETCSSQSVSSCYTCLVEDGVVRRGCGVGDEAGSCVFCNNADGCNDRTLTHCYNCSSADDRHCVDPLSSEGVATTLCDSSCIETIVDDHYMIRGCESPSLTCEGSDSAYCNTCDEELCNNVVKPLGALECYQCGIGNPCNEVGEAGAKPEPCTYYEPVDRCVQYYADYNSTMIRGCLSDSIGGACLDQGNECLNCDTSGCNGLPLYKSPALSCIQCSESEKCAWGFESSAGSVCKKDVLFWQQESCYTVQSSGTVAKRGCVLDEDACNNCKICSTNNCNNENIIKQSCIQCSINDDPSCATVNAQDASECRAPIQTYEDRGCYVLNKGNNIVRGCISDLSTDDRKICSEDPTNNRCLLCLDQSCNIDDLSDSSSVLNVSFAVVLILSTIATYF